jgi:hypothetical protein
VEAATGNREFILNEPHGGARQLMCRNKRNSWATRLNSCQRSRAAGAEYHRDRVERERKAFWIVSLRQGDQAL